MDEEILCPACQRANPPSAEICRYCHQPPYDAKAPASLPDSPESIPLSETASDAAPALEQLPETQPEDDRGVRTDDLVAHYLVSPDFQKADEAVGAYAEAFLASRNDGKDMILKETAGRQIIATAIFAVACFITLSLMMLYHRSYFLFVCVFAALGLAFWFTRVSNRSVLAKKLASMPQAEMENVLMSVIDGQISRRKVRFIRIGMLAVMLALFAGLFWSPHMIFEPDGIECSLRYYTASIRPEKDVVLPGTWDGRTVTSIRGNVFQGLSGIETVVLPDRLEEIRAHAFRGCRNLRTVVFPDSIRSIGSSAFRDCPRLRQVTLPRGCQVNERAFKDSGTQITRK